MSGNLAFDMLEYIDTHVIGDAPSVKAKNSVLRIMTTRARCIRRDLVSSRHVIRRGDPDLVSADHYTIEPYENLI